MYAEPIKAQTEALKKTKEERRELFDYLRESDNCIQELVLGAIRERGEILKTYTIEMHSFRTSIVQSYKH